MKRIMQFFTYVNRTSIFRFVEKKVHTCQMMKAIHASVPFTSVGNVNKLTKGAHIKFYRSSAYTDHAIVTDVNKEERTFTVIKCTCKDKNNPESETVIKEETMKFDEIKDDVFLVNYKDSHSDKMTPNFKPLEPDISIAVAQGFKENYAKMEPELMKDCEHFAFSCTLGYPINLQEMKRLIIAFEALKMFDKSSISEIMDQMASKMIVIYEEKKSKLELKLQSGELIQIPLSC